MLTTSFEGNPAPFHLSPDFVALSDLRWGLSSPTKRNLCGIQVCSSTHVVYACMYINLQPNRLASSLGQVIWLDLASTQDLASQCHLDSQLTWPTCLDVIPNHRVSSAITTHLVIPSRMGPRVIHNIGTSWTSIYLSGFYQGIGPSYVHTISFTDSIPNSGCMIQPPTHGLGRKYRHTCVFRYYPWKIHFKEIALDTRLATLTLIVIHICVTS